MQVLLKATLAGVSGVPGLVQEPLNACELELTFWLPGVVLPVTVNAVSGYSGGGKPVIAEFEDESSPDHTDVPYRIYAMSLAHKHVPEMQAHADEPLRSALNALHGLTPMLVVLGSYPTLPSRE